VGTTAPRTGLYPDDAVGTTAPRTGLYPDDAVGTTAPPTGGLAAPQADYRTPGTLTDDR
jgi:hypothetical protein